MKSLNELLNIGSDILKNAGIADADNDAWLLLEHVYGLSRAMYYMEPLRQVNETEYLEKIEIRAQHYPLQYITGCQWFMGYPFKVNESVLIPRQDTELLVECAVSKIKDKDLNVLDMCTGSGCIAISIDKLCRNANVTAADISTSALEVALYNNDKNGANVRFLESDLFGNIHGKYDIIISNPPYIPTKVIGSLMPEVKDFEPVIALDGSDDGLEFYESITSQSVKHLNNGGMLLYEIGCEQAESVANILEKNGFKNIAVHKDFAGLDRVVECRYILSGKDREYV